MLTQNNLLQWSARVRLFNAVVPGIAVALFSCFANPAVAQETRPRQPMEPASEARQVREPEQTRENALPIPGETKVETKHEWSAGARPVHYTATAGNLIIRDEEGKANGSIFYTAYTEDGAPGKGRPVTFLYNGGPGSATL